MLWIISCLEKPDIADVREKTHQRHSDYLSAKFKEGVLAFSGGQLSHDGKALLGSVLIIDVNDADQAQAFADAIPFNQAGVFAKVAISRIRKGRWNPQAMEHAVSTSGSKSVG